MSIKARRGATLGLWVSLTLVSTPGLSEQLPFRSYTTIDGLAHDRIKRIVVDHDGFVWFCTLEGLSRFDGRRFTTFGPSEGLPQPSVNDVLETPAGFYAATNGGGVGLLDTLRAAPRFRAFPTGEDAASRVNVLALDGEGAVVAGTDGGLFRLEGETFRPVPMGIPGWADASVAVWAFLTTPSGLLVGTQRGLVLVSRDGAPRGVPLGELTGKLVTALAARDDGTILVGTSRGIVVIDATSLAVRSLLTTAEGLPGDSITAFHVGSGRVLVGTESGLGVIGKGGTRAYGQGEGVAELRISAVTEDRDGGIWMGTPVSGAVRL
ncbi:MAG TPA: two-component regulator propeller domain-containing protein, partial [Thermoanaerobaculia bacterium]|nr:two-component regulator propeller domain-containing protein [Thermoanaerobaculia bacterium]